MVETTRQNARISKTKAFSVLGISTFLIGCAITGISCFMALQGTPPPNAGPAYWPPETTFILLGGLTGLIGLGITLLTGICSLVKQYLGA